MAEREKVTVSYQKLTAEYMKSYIEAHGTDADKKAFIEAAFVEKVEQERVAVLNSDGTPKMRLSKKTNKPYIVTKMQDKKGGKKKKVYSNIDAKNKFCELFAPELLPEKTGTTKKDKASDIFAAWM